MHEIYRVNLPERELRLLVQSIEGLDYEPIFFNTSLLAGKTAVGSLFREFDLLPSLYNGTTSAIYPFFKQWDNFCYLPFL